MIINYYCHWYRKLIYEKHRYIVPFQYGTYFRISILYKGNEVINISKSIIGLSQTVSIAKRNRGYVQQEAGTDLTLSRFLQRYL